MILAAARRLANPKLLRALALAARVAASLATVFTVPASAQSYRVTVELADGTLTEVVLDLPEGTTLEEILTHPDLPGTPISLEPVTPEADGPADAPGDDGVDTAPTVIDERKLDGAPDARRREQWIELVRDGGDE